VPDPGLHSAKCHALMEQGSLSAVWWPNTQGDEWEVHGKHAPPAYDSSVGFQVQHRTRPDPPPPERERASLHAARPQPRMRRGPERGTPVRAQACEEITAAKRAEALEILGELGKLEGKLHNAQAPPPPSPRTKWTRLVHPSVLIGH
jgi:hypothetical protein